jgi:hypothetical protein
MMKRILLAGLLGGVALFAWEFVAHDLTPLGTAGMGRLDQEDAMRAYFKQNVAHPGLYYFPAPVLTPGMSSAQQQEAMTKAADLARTGPTGMLLVHGAQEMITPRQLITQLVLDVLSMLVAAFLLARLPATSFLNRLLFVTALAFLPGLRTLIPMWNWYGYPTAYTIAQIGIDVVGFFIAGLILAKMVAQSRSKTMAAAS